jgi:hypothetical protein
VRLVGTAGGPRVMGALRGRVDQASRSQADWDVARGLKQEIVKASSVQSERGVVRLVPSADLEPGEYAIVLRPIHDTRRERRRNSETSLGELLGGSTSQILYLTWEFSIGTGAAVADAL